MPKPSFQAAAEGLPTRRQVLGAMSLAATGMVISPAFARISGINDAPFASQKFTGPDWYALGSAERGSGKRIMWAYRDGHPFIALSSGPDLPVEIYVSHRQFDRVCWGVCRPVSVGGAA